MTARRAYVHVAYGIGAVSYRERYRSGMVPDETPYGFHNAAAMGWELTFSIDHPETPLTRIARHVITRCCGFDLIHAFRNRKEISKADIVWTMEEIQYLAVCALPFLVPGMSRPSLIAQTVWLFDKWPKYSGLRQQFLRKLLRRADVLTFHSREYLQSAARYLPNTKRRLLYFGISTESFSLVTRQCASASYANDRCLRLLSLGNDSTRDWSTLLAAFGNDTRFAVVVVSNQISGEVAGRYINLRCPRYPTMDEYREFYQWADFVVIAMTPNLYSGITVALEATAMGTAVLSSRTGGVPTYFSEEEVLYVPPGSVEALRMAVLSSTPRQREVFATNAQLRFTTDDYSTRGMARRYVELSTQILRD